MLISTSPFYYINDIHIGKEKKNNNNKTKIIKVRTNSIYLSKSKK